MTKANKGFQTRHPFSVNSSTKAGRSAIGQTTGLARAEKPDDEAALSSNEIGFLAQGITLAFRALKSAGNKVAEQYALGPRGGWILVLILNGNVVYPRDITNFFSTAPNLISAELRGLLAARLITQRRCVRDKRRFELNLTPLGERAARLVRVEFSNLFKQRLATYTRAEMLFCARMLRDLTLPENRD